ncbi:MAG: hypothetical protein HFJ94_09230 [Muribaculaceae bacterium]|nr:hypothetical protein [Muribaculaceae bacterium]
MKYIKLLSTILLAAVLSNCGRSAKSGDSDNIEHRSLQGIPLAMSEDFIGRGLEMIVGDTMIFNSYDPQYMFLTATERNDSIVMQNLFAHKGGGPDEFIYAKVFKGYDGTPCIAGGTTSSITSVSRLSLCPIGYFDRKPIDCCNGVIYGDRSIVAMNPDSLLFVGASFSDARHIYSILDINKNKLSAVDYWPDDGYNGNDLPKLMLYFSNSRLFTNGNGKYVYSLGVNRYVYIFELEDNKVKITSRLFDNMVEYTQAEDGLNYKYHPGAEGLRLRATPDAIYILLIDKDKEGNKAENFIDSQLGNVVLTYNWDGEMIARYELDYNGFDIAINPADKHMYLQTADKETGEYGLVKYNLLEQ